MRASAGTARLAGLPIGWADGMVRAAHATSTRAKRPITLGWPVEISIAPEYRAQRRQLPHRWARCASWPSARACMDGESSTVRPSLKARYPLTAMERITPAGRSRARTARRSRSTRGCCAHWRVGGEILTVAYPSMVIEATSRSVGGVDGLRLPRSRKRRLYRRGRAFTRADGPRVQPGSLMSSQNVWVHHPLTTARLA